jgi:Flp pilus assembly protein TadD
MHAHSSDFLGAIAIEPNDADLHTTRGYCLHQSRLYREAMIAYDNALRLNPTHRDALFNKAMICKELSEFDCEVVR